MTHFRNENDPEHYSNIGCMMNWWIKICVVTNFTRHMHLKLEYITPLTPCLDPWVIALMWLQIVSRHKLRPDITWLLTWTSARGTKTRPSAGFKLHGSSESPFKSSWIFDRVALQTGRPIPIKVFNESEARALLTSSGKLSDGNWLQSSTKSPIATPIFLLPSDAEKTPHGKLKIEKSEAGSIEIIFYRGIFRTYYFFSPVTVPRRPLNGLVRKSLPVSLIKSRWPNLIIIVETPRFWEGVSKSHKYHSRYIINPHFLALSVLNSSHKISQSIFNDSFLWHIAYINVALKNKYLRQEQSHSKSKVRITAA